MALNVFHVRIDHPDGPYPANPNDAVLESHLIDPFDDVIYDWCRQSFIASHLCVKEVAEVTLKRHYHILLYTEFGDSKLRKNVTAQFPWAVAPTRGGKGSYSIQKARDERMVRKYCMKGTATRPPVIVSCTFADMNVASEWAVAREYYASKRAAKLFNRASDYFASIKDEYSVATATRMLAAFIVDDCFQEGKGVDRYKMSAIIRTILAGHDPDSRTALIDSLL